MNDIHSITLESTENGYTLVVEADFGSITGALNDLDVMRQLIVAAKHAQSYIDLHDEAFAAWQVDRSKQSYHGAWWVADKQ